MLLQNKKTGVRGELFYLENEEKPIRVHALFSDCWREFSYKTLGELIKDWKDFIVHEPVEPLIEDPKARKVFREWADLLGAKLFRVEHLCKYSRTIITSTDLMPKPAIVLPGYIGEDSETYTRVELCGEEE